MDSWQDRALKGCESDIPENTSSKTSKAQPNFIICDQTL